MTDAPRARGRWSPAAVLLLLGLGAALVIGGAVRALVVKSSIDHPSTFTDTMPTLPVHQYTQFTQRVLAPDYAGLWIGIAVAVIGAAVVAVGIVVARAALRRPAGY